MSEAIVIRPQRQHLKTTYQVEYYDEFGNRKRKSKKTKGEAEEFAADLRDQLRRRKSISDLRASGVVIATPGQVESLVRANIQTALVRFYEAKKSVALDPKDLTSLKIEKLAYNLFGEFIMDTRNRTFVDEIDLNDMEAFRAFLQTKKLKNATVVRKENSIKAFLNYCVDHKYLPENPASKLRTLPVVTPPRKTLRGTNYREQIEDALPEWCSEPFIVQGETFGRNIEILRMRVRDINLHAREVRLISTKGNHVHERWLPLTERGFKIVLAALTKRMMENRAQEADYLFLNSRGNPITSDVYCDVIKKTRVKLNLPEWATAYLLRHDGIKSLRRAKVHTSLISEFAGHRKSETTAVYLRGENEELRNVIDLVDVSKRKITGT